MLLDCCLSCPICNVGVLWPNGSMDQDETGFQVGLGRGNIVLDGDPAPPPPKGHNFPIFGPYCVRWWPSSPLKGAQPRIFDPCLLWPNGWMHQDTTWYGGRPHPRRRCVRWRSSTLLKVPQTPVFGPCLLWPNGWMDQDATWYGSTPRPRPRCVRRAQPLPRKGHSRSPSFCPMSTVVTVAHLSYCWALVI